MAIIPPFFMDSVVALGIKTSEGKNHWLGTGFLVGRKEKEDPSMLTVYVITNKHVVEGQNTLLVRFNNIEASGVLDLPMILFDEGSGVKYYSEHPMKNTDVVAIQIVPQIILQNHLSLSVIDIEDHALTLEQMKQSGVDEGNLVYALGFPMNLVNDNVKAPICRLGCISRVADAFVNPATAEQFLVDAQTFPGNSGGPIISRPEHISIDGTPHNTKANLIGILSAYIPYQDTLLSVQTKQPIMIREENSGLTIVHPVNRIKEVIEIEYLRAELQRAQQASQTSAQPTEQKDVQNEKAEAIV